MTSQSLTKAHKRKDDALLEELLKRELTVEDLRKITSEKVTERVLEEVKPLTKAQKYKILSFRSPASSRVASQLVEEGTNQDLRKVIEKYRWERLPEKACQKLFDNWEAEEDLRYIVTHGIFCPRVCWKEAGRMLWKSASSIEELSFLFEECKPLRQELFEEIVERLEGTEKRNFLEEVITSPTYYSQDLGEKAIQKLRQEEMETPFLKSLFEKTLPSEFENEIMVKLLDRAEELSSSKLCYIFERTEGNTKHRAVKRFKKKDLTQVEDSILEGVIKHVEDETLRRKAKEILFSRWTKDDIIEAMKRYTSP